MKGGCRQFLPTPGSVWMAYLWVSAGSRTTDLSLRATPCLVLTVSAQDDRSDPEGRDIRRCRLLTRDGSITGVLSSMLDLSHGRLACSRCDQAKSGKSSCGDDLPAGNWPE
jgi:hypothetical protein